MKNKNLKDPLFSWGRSLYAVIGMNLVWLGGAERLYDNCKRILDSQEMRLQFSPNKGDVFF